MTKTCCDCSRPLWLYRIYPCGCKCDLCQVLGLSNYTVRDEWRESHGCQWPLVVCQSLLRTCRFDLCSFYCQIRNAMKIGAAGRFHLIKSAPCLKVRRVPASRPSDSQRCCRARGRGHAHEMIPLQRKRYISCFLLLINSNRKVIFESYQHSLAARDMLTVLPAYQVDPSIALALQNGHSQKGNKR